ncbi:MAG TPA: 23S rRNA (adenine(2503)-C(2))-methyltransferase RlmN, partial [Deltaproteobacteria bacterium]|nr:23S rRNA (adenine(2503)-C(2))-methyltransferase RlmN [Deltaproteobacteria bacterium]
MINLLNLDKEQMKGLFSDRQYRGTQVFTWVFAKAVSDIRDMTNLSKATREELSKTYVISYPEPVRTQVSSDGTEKLAYRLHDGQIIESVLMPEKNHWSLCISSQVG